MLCETIRLASLPHPDWKRYEGKLLPDAAKESGKDAAKDAVKGALGGLLRRKKP